MFDPGVIAGIVIVGVLSWWVYRNIKYYGRLNALLRRLKEAGALVSLSPAEVRGQQIHIGGQETRWRAGVLAILPDGVQFYPKTQQMQEHLIFTADQLRWFGRPVKYHGGTNEMWLHLEQAGGWHLLKFGMSRYAMAKLVRALKQIATEEQNRAYRRRRPYVHYGPLHAAPAQQDIHGAWALEEVVTLYLTPSHLVILREGQVLRKFPLASIQQIGAFKRVDAPAADGLLRFQMEGEKFAFALADYEAFALALAEAAKRTLEDPIIRKQKAKAYQADDTDYDYEEEDAEDYEEYRVGDDGEIVARM